MAVLTLNRPDRLNAYTADMGHCWARRTATATRTTTSGRSCLPVPARRSARVRTSPTAPIPLTHPPTPLASRRRRSTRQDSLRTPVIAALNGHAIGIGLTLALQADIRIVAAEAKYGVVQVRRGVIGDCMSHWTLPRLAGAAVAAELLLTGRTFDGVEAVARGIATRAVPSGDVVDQAMEIARDIAVNVAPMSAAPTSGVVGQPEQRVLRTSGRLDGDKAASPCHGPRGCPRGWRGLSGSARPTMERVGLS